MNRNTGMNLGQIIGTMAGKQVIGLEIAKQVFQLHSVDMATCESMNVQIKRAKVLEPGPWLEQIKALRTANVVIVAQAAKMARAIWAVTAKEQSFQKGFQCIRPNTAGAA